MTLPTLLLSLLLCAGLYLLSASLDAAFLGFGALFFLSLLSGDYKLSWVGGHVSWYSDFAGIAMHAPPLLYTRLLAFLAFGGLFLWGLLAKRHHGLGFRASIGKNRGRRLLAPLALMLTAGCVFACAAEPFVDVNSPLLRQSELSRWGNSEDSPRETAAGDLKVEKVHSAVALENGRLSATAAYAMEPTDFGRELSFTLNGGLSVQAVAVDGVLVPYILDRGQLSLTLPAGAGEVHIAYAGRIKSPSLQSLAGYIGEKSVYLQEGTGWLPVPGGMALGTTLIGSITANENLTFAVPGSLTGVDKADGRKTWRYEMTAPSLDAALYGGEYEVLPLAAEGVSVELYVSPRHAGAVADSGLAEVVEDVVRFYSETLGPYPFDTPLRVVETALYKGGGHSSLNLVTVAETAFNMVEPGPDGLDSFAWQNAVDLTAHEIAHQWWGSGVQVALEAPWSSEGLASFMAGEYLARAFSPEVADSMCKYPWLSSVEEKNNSYFSDPVALAKLSGARREQVAMELLHTGLYYEMPLLLMDMEETLGTELFYERLSGVYRYYAGRETPLAWRDFCAEMGLREEEIGLARFYADSEL